MDGILLEWGGWPVNGKKLPPNLLCICLPGSRKLLRSRPGRRARPLPVTTNLFRRPPCRDDLVRRAASKLRHIIEVEDKCPDAGRGRTHFDNQVADLRLRHLRAHRVPTVPAFAGDKAE